MKLTPEQAEAIKRLAEKELIRRGRLPREGLLRFVVDTHPGYSAGWFHRELCAVLEEFSRAVAAGESPRLLIFAPPRHGKSEIVSRRFPVWHLGHNADHEIIVATYGQELSDDHSRAAREIARSEKAASWFPDIRPSKKEKTWYADYRRNDVDKITNWGVGGGGSFKSVGVGGPLTGRGGNILIVDDPVKDALEAVSAASQQAAWDWYSQVAYTRVAPGGGIVVMMTRWAQGDLAGRILEHAAASGKMGDWKIVRFPAIATEQEAHRNIGDPLHAERWPLNRLEDIRSTLGERAWQALYQQEPIDKQGGMFTREMFTKRYQQEPLLLGRSMDEIYISADTALKSKETSDFHAIHVWGVRGADWYLLGRVHGRMGYQAFEQTMDGLIGQWKPLNVLLSVVVEDTAIGAIYIQTHQGIVQNLIPFLPGETPGKDKGKTARAVYFQRSAQAGQVWLPEPSAFSWAEDVVAWWCGYPYAKHDDDMDSASQVFVKRAKETSPSGVAPVDQFAWVL